MSDKSVTLTDKEILAIAGKIGSAPVTPWQLKDDVTVGDIRKQSLSFARAVIEAQEAKSTTHKSTTPT